MPKRSERQRAKKAAKAAPSPTASETAARRVYNNEDLRSMIFSLVTGRALAGLFRLERGVVESVAKVVYRHVHTSVAEHMDPTTERGGIYCRAVRSIDLSPLAQIDDPYDGHKGYTHQAHLPQGEKLDPKSTLHTFTQWEQKFPRLHTIRNEHPFNPLDDIYNVHVRDGKLYAELETAHEINVLYDRYPESGLPQFPIPPETPQLTIIRHSLAITVTRARRYANHYPFWNGTAHRTAELDEAVDEIANTSAWAAYLCSSALDRRVTSIVVEGGVDSSNGFDDWALSPDIHFLRGRQATHCEPWKSSFIPHTDEFKGTAAGLQGIQDALEAMGSGLKDLHLDASVVWACQGWGRLIALLDRAFPSLELLEVSPRDPESQSERGSESERETGDSDSGSDFECDKLGAAVRYSPYDLAHLRTPLTGLPNLRKFTFRQDVTIHNGNNDRVAANICGLGAAGCVYQNTSLDYVEYMEKFSDKVKACRSKRSEQHVSPLEEKSRSGRQRKARR